MSEKKKSTDESDVDFYNLESTKIYIPSEEPARFRILEEPKYKLFKIAVKNYRGEVVSERDFKGASIRVCELDNPQKEFVINCRSKSTLGAFQALGEAKKRKLVGVGFSISKTGIGIDSEIHVEEAVE